MYKFKKGDKVKIPKVKKTADGYLIENCCAILYIKRRNQDFLYINRIYENNIQCSVGETSEDNASSFYLKDLELYENVPEVYKIFN